MSIANNAFTLAFTGSSTGQAQADHFATVQTTPLVVLLFAVSSSQRACQDSVKVKPQ
nr:hypothetical protein [Halomonas sp. HL-48]